MSPSIPSEAFRQATLRSERYRTLGLLAVCGGFILLSLVRAIVSTYSRPNIQRYSEFISFWLICAVYELLMLWLIGRAGRQNRPLRPWASILNTCIECLFPSIAALGLTMDKSYLGPYLALQSGNLIIYAFFIILSTLRLRPALCVLAGTVSALGYLAVYFITLWGAPKNPNRLIYPVQSFYMTPFVLFMAGLIAAAVAHQIRQHVIAALQEAETRRKLDHIEHDLQIARSIQMDLLPKKPPTVASYDIAGWSKPADQTGGDYYDWMELPAPPGSAQGGAPRILFTIADATGHGIGPALLVASCRAYFRALASHNDPLESITAQVDALLARDIPPGRFITAAVALMDPGTHELLLYSAGHAPLYFYDAASRRVAQFDSDQPPLGIAMAGVVDAAPSQARRIQLAPGDALVLVTDGFFECTDAAGELFGTDRLAEAIQRHQDKPAAAMIEMLYQETLSFTKGARQADDLTAVIIRRERQIG